MPICRDCNGTGQRELKKEITTQCPDCHGAKSLRNGDPCNRCDKWGQVGTGKFSVQKKLCQTCLGSGKVSEGSLTTWFLVWVVPATFLILGVGAAGVWAAWTFLQQPIITAVVAVIFFGGWGAVISYFIRRMPNLGEISPATWFLIRAVPTTLVALGAGGAIVWAIWLTTPTPTIAIIVGVVLMAVWGAVMYYFISHMPE
jgi:hypothetical protein